MTRQTKDQRIAELERELLKAQRAARRLYYMTIPGAPGWKEIEAREIMAGIGGVDVGLQFVEKEDAVL